MFFYTDTNYNIMKNIEPKLQEFKNCLKQWQHRKLTLIGKITVIKTFALPKLIYPLTVLPNINEIIIKDIIDSMFKFIWDNKPDKIKRKQITKDYKNGGLKMINFKKFLLALKAGWISRILNKNNNGQWKLIYLQKLKRFGGELIFECNITNQEIDKLIKRGSFISDVIKSWIEIKSTTRTENNNLNVSSEIIWNNKNLKISNKVYCFKNWFQAGVKYIKDIFDYDNRRFYSYIDLIRKFDLPINDFLKYMSLIASIPAEWKTKIKNENNILEIQNKLLSKLNKSKQKNKL